MQVSRTDDPEAFKPIGILLTIESEEELKAISELANRTITFPAILAGGRDTIESQPEVESKPVYRHVREFLIRLRDAVAS